MRALSLVLLVSAAAFAMAPLDPQVALPTNLPTGIDAPNPRRIDVPARGAWQALIILVDFPDYPWTRTDDPNFDNTDLPYPTTHYTDMLFSSGSYRDFRSASPYTGSMRDYYQENSYGAFDLTGTVTTWYRLPQPYSYYVGSNYGMGDYPNNSQKMTEDALAAADPDIDFSQFDNDGDGVVDALFVIHAGPGAEAVGGNTAYIWSHAWSIASQTRDGVQLESYSTEPEDATIGVVCHEFGHVLGLPDLYDTDGSSEGVGEWCLMGSAGWCYRDTADAAGTCPGHFAAWCKSKLGWLTPERLTDNRYGVLIPPVETSAVAYRLWRGGSYGAQYFLVENRQPIGFDAGLTRRQKEFRLGTPTGLLVMHIDELKNSNRDELHRKVDVEEATPYAGGGTPYEHLDHVRDRATHRWLNYGNRGDNGDLWPGFADFAGDLTDFTAPRSHDHFDDSTAPSARDYSGAVTHVKVRAVLPLGTDVQADLMVAEYTGAVAEQPGRPGPAALTVQPTVGAGTMVFTARPGAPLVVYDSQGRRVRVLRADVLGRAVWDGTDRAGRPVAAAVYFVQAPATGRGACRLVRL